MKKVILILLMALFPMLFYAQAPYTLLVSQESYVPLNDPISINEGDEWDEWSSFPVYFGFTIPIFGGEVSSLNINPGYGFNFPTFGDYHLFLYNWPFGGPLLLDRGYMTGSSQSQLSYQIDGEEGERVVKLQWDNTGFVMDIDSSDFYEPTNSDYVNFQIWIYEADGMIKIHFGPNSVLNPNSYGNWNGGVTGPFTNFIIGNNLIDFYGNADNPTYDWYSNEGIQYGQMLNGIPSEGILFQLTPNFDNVAMSAIQINENDIKYRWNPNENSLTIDVSSDSYYMGSINVYSVDGKLILSDILDKNQTKYTLFEIEEGIYIAKVLINSSINTFKFKK